MTALPARTLLVTNDFPPRFGGIQSYVYSLAVRQPPGSLVVYTSAYPGAAEFDAAQPFPVIRDRAAMLLPAARVARRAAALARATGCTRAWFGAMAPLGLLSPALRRAGVRRCVALTHGHEVGWTRLPGAYGALRRIAASVDVVTCVSDYTRRRLEPRLAGTRVEKLSPGVDVSDPRARVGRLAIRARRRLGIGERPVVVCVSRLVARKGQDVLVRALPAVRRAVPGAVLLLVGEGPDAARLHRLATAAGVAGAVIFTGAVRREELAGYYAAGDVFAMPCRSRWGGFDVEGLGMVYLEAAAAGLPVVAGSSGGAPEAVRDGETGYVVAGKSVGAIAQRLTALLRDPVQAAEMGAKGRSWMEREWRWERAAERLAALLD